MFTESGELKIGLVERRAWVLVGRDDILVKKISATHSGYCRVRCKLPEGMDRDPVKKQEDNAEA